MVKLYLGRTAKYWVDAENVCHRLNGPAFEHYNGTKHWMQSGKWHRLDGPSIEYRNGEKIWYYQNEKINCANQEEFERLIKLKILW